MTEKKVVIQDCKLLNKGALHAKLKIYVPKWDLEIREVLCFKKGSEIWFNMPSKDFQDEDGQKKYMQYIRFGKPESAAAFQKVLKDELNLWLADNNKPEEDPLNKEEIPF